MSGFIHRFSLGRGVSTRDLENNATPVAQRANETIPNAQYDDSQHGSPIAQATFDSGHPPIQMAQSIPAATPLSPAIQAPPQRTSARVSRNPPAMDTHLPAMEVTRATTSPLFSAMLVDLVRYHANISPSYYPHLLVALGVALSSNPERFSDEQRDEISEAIRTLGLTQSDPQTTTALGEVRAAFAAAREVAPANAARPGAREVSLEEVFTALNKMVRLPTADLVSCAELVNLLTQQFKAPENAQLLTPSNIIQAVRIAAALKARHVNGSRASTIERIALDVAVTNLMTFLNEKSPDLCRWDGPSNLVV
jgi:hypothetical protein